MVQVRINIVDTNSVDTEALHQRSITETDLGVGERILAVFWVVSRGSSWLVGDTDNLEALASGLDNEIWTLDGERGEGRCELSAKAEERDRSLGDVSI